jgi:hypothetical protein
MDISEISLLPRPQSECTITHNEIRHFFIIMHEAEAQDLENLFFCRQLLLSIHKNSTTVIVKIKGKPRSLFLQQTQGYWENDAHHYIQRA